MSKITDNIYIGNCDNIGTLTILYPTNLYDNELKARLNLLLDIFTEEAIKHKGINVTTNLLNNESSNIELVFYKPADSTNVYILTHKDNDYRFSINYKEIAEFFPTERMFNELKNTLQFRTEKCVNREKMMEEVSKTVYDKAKQFSYQVRDLNEERASHSRTDDKTRQDAAILVDEGHVSPEYKNMHDEEWLH